MVAELLALHERCEAAGTSVSDALVAWIDFISQREGGLLSGPVIRGYAFYQRFRRWKRCFYPENRPPIEDNILRHTFGTDRVLELGEVGKVALEMGNSEAMVRQHYLNGDHTVGEAERFWSLTPEAVLRMKSRRKLRNV